MSASLKTCWHKDNDCNLIVLPAKTGSAGRCDNLFAVQSTCSLRESVGRALG